MIRNRHTLYSGFTLVEVLIVIAIIAILSVYYIVNLRPNTLELLKMDTNRLAADVRYVRSMTASRATYNGSFPAEGYGILFKNGNGTSIPSYYTVFAGYPSNEIKRVTLSNVAFRLVDPNSYLSRMSAINDTAYKDFSFKSENTVRSSLELSADGDYQLEIYYGFVQDGQDYYYLSRLDLGRRTADNFVWSNLAITYTIKGVMCGNGIVENGESCERFAEDGTTVVDDSCFPAGFVVGGVDMGCKFNSCGDGIIAGSETCEQNPNATGVIRYLNRCINLPHLNWCYTCSALDATVDDCKDMNGNTVNCCLSHLTSGTCTDCQWSSTACFHEPKICPLDGAGE